MQLNKIKLLFIIFIGLILLSFNVFAGCESCSDNRVTSLSAEEAKEASNFLASIPEAYIDNHRTREVKESPSGHFSLLQFLDYDPEERNQGNCGNCWAWAGTAIFEIALNVQEGIRDRLSIQYLNSNYEGEFGWACKGSLLTYFRDFYNKIKKIIPWSNTNAEYGDTYPKYANYSNILPSHIYTKKYYPIESVEWERIPTWNLSDETAINNIKSVLHQGKAIWLGLFMTSSEDWGVLKDFWGNNPENAVWNPDYSCGKEWADGGGHAIVIVGYDERAAANPYWIVLNSWGTANGSRPHGTFNMDMDINYDCQYYSEGEEKWSLNFETLDVDFGSKDGVMISPVTSNSVRVGRIGITDEPINAGEELKTTTYLENNKEYMDLKNIRITYIIPDLGIRKRVGPFKLKRNKDIIKDIELEIPPDTPPGEYDVRITISNGQFKRVKYRVITVV